MTNLEVVFKAVDGISDKLTQMSTEGDSAADKFDKIGESADNSFGKLRDGISKSKESVHGLGESEKQTGEEAEKMGETSVDAMQSIGSVMVSLGIASKLREMADGFRECSDAAAEYETGIAKVMTIADPAKTSTKEMTDAISAMSDESGQSVADLSEATYQAISASIDTANAVGFVGTADKLAVGGFTDSANAVDVLTTAINAYRMSATDTGKIADYLITTQNLGKTTVDALAHSIGQVIPVASAYNVQLDDLSTAYAVMTANGINTANATTGIRAMLNELADSSSNVSVSLSKLTGSSFSQLMSDGKSLGDVLQILGNSVDGDATAFSNLWGSSRAAVGALSLYNSGAERYQSVLEQMRGSVGATDKAYEKMTNTEEFATKKLQNSMENMKIAFGQDVNPALVKVQGQFTSLFEAMGKGVSTVPGLSSIMVGLGSALMVTAGSIAAVTLATNVLIPALSAAGIASAAALGPFLLIGATVGVLTAAFVAQADAEQNATASLDEMTYATQEQHQKIVEMKSAYDLACEKYGETSEEASRLKYQVDDLSAAYDSSKQTMEEFISKSEELVTAHQKTMEELGKGTEKVNANEKANYALIQKLSDLTSAQNISTDAESAAKAIIEQLNHSVDGLNMSYDDLIKNQPQAIDYAKKAAEAQAKQDYQVEKVKDYTAALKDQMALQDQYTKITSEKTQADQKLTEAQAAYNAQYQEYADKGDNLSIDNLAYSDLAENVQRAQQYSADLATQQDNVSSAMDEATSKVQMLSDAFDAAQQSAQDQGTTTEDSGHMAATAIEGVQDDLKTLCESYDKAYDAALQSINGQVGAFDIMKVDYADTAKEVKASIDEINKAWDSQLQYLDRYNQNMQAAASAGISSDILSQLSDGSAESATKLDAIVQKVNELGGAGSEKATQFVDGFNAKFAEVTTAKETFATNVAGMKTDFDTNMTAIQQRMSETIADMNKSTEASAAAKSTMDAYVSQIRTGVAQANAAIGQLNLANLTVPGLPQPTKHALGGIFDTPHYGVFAEDGPEAFIPIEDTQNSLAIWEQTGRLLGAIDDVNNSNGPSPTEISIQPSATEQPAAAGSTGDRNINLSINGSGAIKINAADGDERVLSLLTENIKPVLMNIIKEEIMDEGDESYEF